MAATGWSSRAAGLAGTLQLTARPVGKGRVRVRVQPRTRWGGPIRGDVPVALYISGSGAAVPPGAPMTTLPRAGTPAWQVRGVARGGCFTTTLQPVDEPVTVTAAVAALSWPVTSLRLPFIAAGQPCQGWQGWHGWQAGRPWHAVTFNVHHGRSASGFDPVAASRALAGLEPDVALLQEVDDNRQRSRGADLAGSWAHDLGMTGVFGPTMADPRGVDGCQPAWFGNAILSRGRVVEASNMALPRLAESREPRGLLTALVATPYGLRAVHCVHLSLHASERLVQAWVVRRLAGDTASRCLVLGGDINSTAWAAEYQLLVRLSSRYDAWRAAGSGPGDTTGGAMGGPRRRVDVLFPAKGLRARRVHVSRSGASDHGAVRAVIAPEGSWSVG